MSDPFAHFSRGLESPAAQHALLVASNSADLAVRPRVVYCAAAGTAVLRDQAGRDLSYALEAGQILPLSPVRLLATGTSATLYGWW